MVVRSQYGSMFCYYRSSGSYRMVQVNAQISGQIEEIPLMKLAPACLHAQANLHNDTESGFFAGLFRNLDCADVLARTNNGQGFK
jgi:hypothetical protein